MVLPTLIDGRLLLPWQQQSSIVMRPNTAQGG